MPIKKHAVSRKQQAQILHAKLEWEQTFDAVSDLIFIVNVDHTIARVNRSMAAYFSLSPQELVGRKCFEVMHGTTSAPANCLHARLFECGKPQAAEFHIKEPCGTFEVYSSPIFNAESQITGSVHVARDISEKKRQEELLASQQKQLEEINNSLEIRINETIAELRKKDEILIQQSRLTAMGEMISSIAHQWRQPLNTIGLIVQNLQLAFKAHDLTEQALDEDVADTIAILQKMSDIIDDFRNFFSYEEVTSTFVINDLFARSLPFLEPSMRRKGIRVELDEEPDVTAVGYPNEYMQSFLNIMLNARDVLLDSQVEDPFVSIRIFRENGRSIVTIRDNGGGIREDVLPKIFDPYFTTKQQSMGAGIGLYMSKMIIEKKMHGHLTACNVDKGAEFRIEI